MIGIGAATLTVASAASAPREERDGPPEEDRRFVMADPAMLRVFQVAERFAKVDTPILVLGETGVGKEVLALRARVAARAARVREVIRTAGAAA